MLKKRFLAAKINRWNNSFQAMYDKLWAKVDRFARKTYFVKKAKNKRWGCNGWSHVVMSGYGGYEWLWVVMGGYGWLCVVMSVYGWLLGGNSFGWL